MTPDSKLEWVWSALCVCSASVSVATQPSGAGTFQATLQRNAIRLSPPFSGLLVVTTILRLLSWIVLKTGDLEFCLHFMARFHSGYLDEGIWPSGLQPSPSRKNTIARWAFFTAIAVPQYIRLLVWSDAIWTKVWTTCLLSLFLLNEFLHPYALWRPSPMVFHTEWPVKPLANLSISSSQDRAKMILDGPFLFPPSPPPSNACEPMQRFVSIITNLPLKEVEAEEMGVKPCRRLPFKDWTTLQHAMDNDGFVWTCGHLRCLLYKILCLPARHIIWVQFFAAFGLCGFLVHSTLRPLSILACEYLLSHSTSYWILRAVKNFFALYIPVMGSVILVNAICIMGKKYAIYRSWNFTAPFQFFGTNARRIPLYLICVPAVFWYGGGYAALGMKLDKDDAAFYAWFLYVPALIVVLFFNSVLTDVMAPRSASDAASEQEAPGEKPDVEAPGEKGPDDTERASTVTKVGEHIQWLGIFLFLLSAPCALYWYAIASQRKGEKRQPFSGVPRGS